MSTKLVGLSVAAIAIAIVAIFVTLYSTMGNESVMNSSSYNPQTREIYLFSEVDENIDEDKLGIPPDQFSLDSIVVNKGDTVKVHFANLEPVETQEHHTFTIDTPYNVDLDINAGENSVVEFKATEAGIFEYVCTFHEPTMIGQLIVLDS